MQEPLANPIHFLPSSRIKLVSANILDKKEQVELYKVLKFKAEQIVLEIKPILESTNTDFYTKLVLDNLICEYKNFVLLLEGFERVCKN